MNIKEQIKSLIQQAEIYHKQGLLVEAKQNYAKAGQIIKKNQQLLKNKKILIDISKKIRDIKAEIDHIEGAPTTVEMPENVQNIIMNKFAFAEDEDKKALEGAVALAKFGQFERALKEFNSLIQIENIRVDAAKNIIRCHKVLEKVDDAVALYNEWLTGNLFNAPQMQKLRIFLQDILDKKGMDIVLPTPEREEEPAAPHVEEEIAAEPVPDEEEAGGISMPEAYALELESAGQVQSEPEPEPQPEFTDEDEDEDEEGGIPAEDLIDISSVEITLDEGSQKGETVELDVSFQSGNVINLLISSNDKHLIETLKAGVKLNKLQFYSPIAMFTGKGIVSASSKIESGPKQGDYSLDIRIKTI